MRSYALLFTPLHLRIAYGIESEARPVRSGAETTFFYVPQISQIFTDFPKAAPGEEWVKSGVNSSPVQVFNLQTFMNFW